MKKVFILLLLSFSLNARDNKVGGVIHCPECPQASPLDGKLTIIAKHISSGEIVARTVLNKPNFPQLFLLTSKQSVPLGKLLPPEMTFHVELDLVGKKLTGKNEPRAKLGDRNVELSF